MYLTKHRSWCNERLLNYHWMLCQIKHELYIAVFWFMKTVYFHLWVLCKGDLRISYFRNNGEIILIKHFSKSENHHYIPHFDEIKVSRVTLWLGLWLLKWRVTIIKTIVFLGETEQFEGEERKYQGLWEWKVCYGIRTQGIYFILEISLWPIFLSNNPTIQYSVVWI